MPKRELSKCREWERERRDRLKTCFEALGRVLPSYDPCIVLSKLEILQRATAYIEDLKRRKKETISARNPEQTLENDTNILEERISSLLSRIEQLVNLLKNAGIKVPSECGKQAEFSKPKFWSNKITKEQAEVLSERANNALPNKKEKKKPIKRGATKGVSNFSPKNVSPLNATIKKGILKRVRIHSENKGAKRRHSTYNKKMKISGPVITQIIRQSDVSRNVISSNPSNVLQCASSISLPQSIYVTATVANNVHALPLPRTSLVVSNNTIACKNAVVTNSQVVTSPIMATGINQRNPNLTSLGPGTLILANGSIVPVLSSTPTIAPTLLAAVMNPTPKPTVVMVPNQKSSKTKIRSLHIDSPKKNCTKVIDSKSVRKRLPQLTPKLGITKSTTINKVPIPALRSRYISPLATSNIKPSDKNRRIVKTSLKSTHVKINGCKNSTKLSSLSKQKEVTSTDIVNSNENSKSTPNTSSESIVEKEIDADNLKDNSSIAPMEGKEHPASEPRTLAQADKTGDPTDHLREKVVANSPQKLPVSSYSIDSLCKINSNIKVSKLDKSPQKENSFISKDSGNVVKFDAKTDSEPQHANLICSQMSGHNSSLSSCDFGNNLDTHETSATKTSSATDQRIVDKKQQINVNTKTDSIQTKQPETEISISKASESGHLLQTAPITLSASEASAKPPEALTLSLPHSEFSNDIFASLHVPSGAQHPESISPTAAFLLAFPLVSTLTGGKASEVVDDENSDSQHGTPTLLQIGNIEPTKQPSDNLSSNLLSLDNLHHFFTPKDFASMEIPKISKSPVRKVQELKFNENKFLDFENNESTLSLLFKNKPGKDCELSVKGIDKEKIIPFDASNQINANCIFSDIPLFQNINTVSSSIFNYEHTPVTYSIPKSAEVYPSTDVISNITEHGIKNTPSYHQKKNRTPGQTNQTPIVSYHQNDGIFQPQNTISYPAQKLHTYSHSNVKIDSDLNTPISFPTCKSASYTTYGCNGRFPTNSYDFAYSTPVKQTADKPLFSSTPYTSNIGIPLNVHEQHSVEKHAAPPVDKTYSGPKNGGTTNKLNIDKLTGKVSHGVTSCQNVFNPDENFATASRDQFKFPELMKTKEKHSTQDMYHQENSTNTSQYKTDYNTSKSTDKSQKPLVNWMTTPDIRPTSDLLLPPYAKECESNQTGIFTSNNQTFYNTTNSYYQNMDTVNTSHESAARKSNSLDQPFHVIPPPSNYSRSTNFGQNEENQFSWSPTKLPPLLEHPQHNILVPSTLPTLIGDLALNTNMNHQKPDYDLDCTHKRNMEITPKQYKETGASKCKGKQLYSEQQNSNNFLSVSQLVEHTKSEPRTHSISIGRKTNTSSRPSKSASIGQRQLKRTPKISDNIILPKNQSSVGFDVYGELKSAPEVQDVKNQSSRPHAGGTSFPMHNLDPPNWGRGEISTNKTNYKNCSSNYSAEALIGTNILPNSNVTPSQNKNSRYSTTQHYGSPPKRSQFVTDTIVPPFYSTIDFPSGQDNNYYSQASANTFTYTTVYQHNNSYMTNTSAATNYPSTTGLHTELDTDYSSHMMIGTNANTGTNQSKSSGYPKTSVVSKESRPISHVSSSGDKKNLGHVCATNHPKRNNNARRKQYMQDTGSGNVPALTELGFLSMPTINSPLLSEDPFHSHPNFFPTNAPPQLYSNAPQNQLYTKSLNQGSHEFPSSHSCNMLPPLPGAPAISRPNILPPTQAPVPSPNMGAVGTSLTNFNLSTIFPEINKTGAAPLPGIFNDTLLRPPNSVSSVTASNAGPSNSLPPRTGSQINLANKGPYFTAPSFEHKGPSTHFSSS